MKIDLRLTPRDKILLALLASVANLVVIGEFHRRATLDSQSIIERRID
jgi:hypothetical protein